jgi:PAT family beta-lactamase induction signal transducer AmpG
MSLFPFMQAPGPDRRLASESFRQLFGDLAKLVTNRNVVIGVVMFILPAATFSMSNFLGGVGADFNATPAFVGLIGGVGVVVAGVAGALLFQPLNRLLPARPLYVTVGLVGSCITLALALAPHIPIAYAFALIAQNIIQSLAITTQTAITFDIIGRANPLASTTFCFVNSAYGVPISYMLLIDGAGYRHAGVAGSFAYDGLAGIVASLLLAGMLFALARRSGRRVLDSASK